MIMGNLFVWTILTFIKFFVPFLVLLFFVFHVVKLLPR